MSLRQRLASIFRPNATVRSPASPRRRVHLEQLEDRVLFSVDLIGIPTWIDQGPGPMQGAQVEVPPGDFATGAVESIAINPANPQQIYVGTVNGGLWRTNNANPASPDATVWTPLTDLQGSLATGDIAFSPLDATGNTVFAGTGSFSSLGQAGGPQIGVLRTTDGGATWTTTALPGGAGVIKAVVPTAVDLDPGGGVSQVVLVGSVQGGGLYQSNDSGGTYTLISGNNGLASGDISRLIVDPTNAQRVYAGVSSKGIYRGDISTTTGTITWTQMNNGLTGVGTAVNIQVAAGPTGTLFALLSGSSRGAFRSTDHGDNWTALATPPSMFNRDITFRAGNTMAVDPTNDQVAYISTYGSVDDFVFRYDPSGSGSWVTITNSGAKDSTAPHVDARDLAFQGGNVLTFASDGGIYFMQNPLDSANNRWQSFIGGGGTGLRSAELHNVAWDSRFDVIVAGAQDNGTNVQLNAGNLVWDHFSGGDGGDVQVDAVSRASSSQTVRYYSSQNMDGLSRAVFDSATNIVQNVGILPAGGLSGFTGPFVPVFELNALDPASGQSKPLVVGGEGSNPVYIATMADSISSNTDVTWTAVPVASGFGTVQALAFGGRSGGTDNADVLYAGTNTGLYLRTATGGTLNKVFTGDVMDVAMDPTDWNHVVIVTSSKVWESTNAGGAWTERTGNLSNTNLRTVLYADRGSVDAILVGGLGGVFRTITDDVGDWYEYGQFLPNAVVYDLVYDAGDDVLVAGTLGRGAWKVTAASTTLATHALVRVNGDVNANTIELERRASDPWLLDVDIDGAVTPVLWAAVESIEVNSGDGGDTLIVNFASGDVVPPDGLVFNGGVGNDTLDTRGASFTTVTYTVTGATSGTIAFDASDLVSYSGVQQVIDGTGANARVFIATSGADTVEITDDGAAANGRTRIDDGGTGGFARHDFANPGATLTVNGGGGSDSIALLDADALFATTLSIDAGTGDDDVTVNFAAGVATVNVEGGANGDALRVNGTAQDDTLLVTGTAVKRGTQTVNYQSIEQLTVQAAGGDDDITIDGAAGNILGGTGLDVYLVIASAAAQLRLDGEAGSDEYTVNFGALGGAVIVQDLGPLPPTDTDTLIVNGTSGDDAIGLTSTQVTRGAESIAYSGIEILNLYAGGGNDTVTIDSTGAGATRVYGGNGDDTFVLNGSGPGSLKLDGQEGSDTYVVNLGASYTGPVAIDDTGLTGIDSLVINGTSGDDWIILDDDGFTVDSLPASFTFAGIENLTVNAGAGDDIVDGSALETLSITIYGGAGNDTLIGGAKDDKLHGEDGDDDLIGNLGADLLDGGDGSDALIGDQCVQEEKGLLLHEVVVGPARTLLIPGGRLSAIVDEPGTNRRLITLRSESQGGDDTLLGGDGDDYIHGGAGRDTADGGAGADAMFGNLGDDVLHGGTGDDHLYGGSGKDLLDGDAGADLAYGGDGDDRLVADQSGDRLVDWFGNFNNFVAPGPGYGAPVIVRSPSPWVQTFLLDLARADGAANPNAELVVVVPGSSLQQSNSGKGGRT